MAVQPRTKTAKPPPDPFRWFDSSPEVIRLVMMYVKYPLSLRNVEDMLHERGIDICHETVRFWWRRFGPIFANEIRKKRVEAMRQHTRRWHLDEVYMKINGEMRYLWRAVDHEGEVLESFVTKERDKAAALKFIKRAMKRHGRPEAIVTDGLRSYGAALKEISGKERQEVGRHLNNRAENSHQPFRRRERAMLRFRRMKTLQTFTSVHGTVRNGTVSSNLPELDFYAFLSRIADMRVARPPRFSLSCFRLRDLLPTLWEASRRGAGSGTFGLQCRWTSMSSTTPSLCTARHKHRFSAAILITISSMC